MTFSDHYIYIFIVYEEPCLDSAKSIAKCKPALHYVAFIYRCLEQMHSDWDSKIFNYTASPYYQTHKDTDESPTNKALHVGAGKHVGHQLVRPSQTALSS